MAQKPLNNKRQKFNPDIGRSSGTTFKVPKDIGIKRPLTAGQQILQELFGGSNQTWGTGQNLPKVDGVLRTGEGLIKNGDYIKKTGRMFGLR